MVRSEGDQKLLNAILVEGTLMYEARSFAENSGGKAWYYGPSLDAAVVTYNNDGTVTLHLVASTPNCVASLVPKPSPFGPVVPSAHDVMSVDEIIAAVINTKELREQFDQAVGPAAGGQVVASEVKSLARASLTLLRATQALLTGPRGLAGSPAQAQALAKRIDGVLANHLAQALLA
jgi:hypothetical protein